MKEIKKYITLEELLIPIGKKVDETNEKIEHPKELIDTQIQKKRRT